jgi:AraC-like DNA-binding protein
MAEIHLHLTETTIDGRGTRRWVLEAGECTELASCRIARVGIDEAVPPYERVRLRPAGSFLLACLSGEGRVLLDGRWQRIAAGEVCMAPPRVVNAFHVAKGKAWRFGWMRYDEPAFVAPLVSAASPVRARTGAEEMGRALEGLRAEWQGARDPKLAHHWIGLLHGMARRLARPWQVNSRLWKLWEHVGENLTAPWTIDALAARCHLSGEHLRRLCQRELGRSPMQHVAYMRMQRAQDLLENSDDKLDAIAPAVGYENALVFSRAFKRLVGMSPSDYRGRT